VSPKQADLGQVSGRLSVESQQANQIVSSNGEIAVIYDGPMPHVQVGDRRVPGAAGSHRRAAGPARTVTMWALGLAEGVLCVGGLAVLVSCLLVHDAATATDRAYLGIGLLFAGAVLSVPASALIGNRAVDVRDGRSTGRHRRPRRARTYG
jgi:hypothetical protein